MQRSVIRKEVKPQVFQDNSRFNYVIHSDNYPLELQGKMKTHTKPIVKDNMKELLNYEECKNIGKYNERTKQNVNCQNSRNSHQKYESASKLKKDPLTEKILSNKKLTGQNYEKSVLPGEDFRSTKRRTESLKTYKQTRPGSGVNYLQAVNDKNLYKHPEKRHLIQQQNILPQRQIYGKRHNYSFVNKNESNQIYQGLRQHSINQQNQKMSVSKLSQSVSIIHKQTTNKRIHDDIHSMVFRSQPQINPAISKTKFAEKNQFRMSQQLGYQNKKQKQLNSQKLTQIMGSTYGQKQQINLRQKRDDWRRSTIIIQ